MSARCTPPGGALSFGYGACVYSWLAQRLQRIDQHKAAFVPWVMGRDYDVWDVHTDGKEGRWWVVTSPTNLYSQRLMPSMDYVLSFHIGLMMRMEAHREPAGSETEQELLLVTNRKLVQAGEAFDKADEAEDFQAVGMHCRECLLALIRELTEGGDFDEGGTFPRSLTSKRGPKESQGSSHPEVPQNASAPISRRLPTKRGN